MQKRHQIPFIKDVYLNSPYLHWILYDVENCAKILNHLENVCSHLLHM